MHGTRPGPISSDDTSLKDIEKAGSPLIAKAVSIMREVNITPGFDGEYGKVKISEEAGKKKPANKSFSPDRIKKKKNGQMGLF